MKALVAALLVAGAAYGEDKPGEEPLDLSKAGLSATVQGEKSVLEQPQSIAVLDREDLRRNEGIFIDDVINLVPGVRFESRTVSGGQRITIRGYGNGTNFNGTGYKAYIDGIPLTDAEGTTVLDDVDFSMLRRVDVVKGPTSSLYGQGIGGAVRFLTLRADPNTSRFTQELTGGSQNLFRSNTRYEYGAESGSFLMNYGHQHSDGYRVHSLSNKDYVLLSGEYRPSSKQQITTIASFNHSFDQLAGQLTEQQFLQNQNVAEAPYLANNGHVAIDSLRLGISHRYDFTRGFSNTTTAFGSGYQLNQPFAVGLTDNMALNVGGRTQFDFRVGPVNLAVGSELQQTNAFKKSYGLTNNVLGAIRGDLQVKALQSNTFAQGTVKVPFDIAVTAGASLNYVRYNIADRLSNSTNIKTRPNQSGIKSFDPVVTPRVAIEKTFAGEMTAYAQVSQGYAVPGSGSTIILDPAGSRVNLDLKPERGTLYEVGTKGALMAGRLAWEAALFQLNVQDKLTSQAVTGPTGSVLYSYTVNAGSQSDKGVELSASYDVVRDPQGVLPLVQIFGAYTFSSFTYDNFKVGATDFTGKKVVGVPAHVYDIGADLVSRWGVYANTTFQRVASVPLTYDNGHSAPAYSLLNAKAGYRADLPAGFRLDASVGGRNLTGSTYYLMVFLNQSYAGPPPNVYLPGPHSPTFYGGLNVSKSF